jgi:DNA processing protein
MQSLQNAWTPLRQAMLRLVSAPELSHRMLFSLCKQHSSLDQLLSLPSTSIDLELNERQKAGLERIRYMDIAPVVSMLDHAGIRFVLNDDSEYPDAFRRLSDPPFALFLRGAPLGDGLRVAVIGTRRMTEYGRRCAEFISEALTHHGVTVVSGLAIGADASAHAACVNAGGKTIAVLPGGVDDDSIAPARHRKLAEQILSHDGILLSERPPASLIQPFSFLQRNRLIAALSDAIVVIEADRDSGALVTARLALECGREVLAIPGSIWSQASRGTNELIKHGARPCTSVDDVFAVLGLKNSEQAKQIQEARTSIPVSADEQRILNQFNEPRTVDEVARILDESVSGVNAIMSVLELKGRIISVGPKTFIKSP